MVKIVVVNDQMQRNYRYPLVAPIGGNFDPEFKPELAPKEMLELGVFGGKYMTDCRNEFPRSWFADAKLSPQGKNAKLNFFKVDASQTLSPNGAARAGFIRTIRAAGFSGIAAITWEGASNTTCARSAAGKKWRVMSRKFGRTASPAIYCAARVSDRRCSTGRTTAETSDTRCIRA